MKPCILKLNYIAISDLQLYWILISLYAHHTTRDFYQPKITNPIKIVEQERKLHISPLQCITIMMTMSTVFSWFLYYKRVTERIKIFFHQNNIFYTQDDKHIKAIKTKTVTTNHIAQSRPRGNLFWSVLLLKSEKNQHCYISVYVFSSLLLTLYFHSSFLHNFPYHTNH